MKKMARKQNTDGEQKGEEEKKKPAHSKNGKKKVESQAGKSFNKYRSDQLVYLFTFLRRHT